MSANQNSVSLIPAISRA